MIGVEKVHLERVFFNTRPYISLLYILSEDLLHGLVTLDQMHLAHANVWVWSKLQIEEALVIG